MAETIGVVFIGGPKAGERLTVQAGQPRIYCVELPPVPLVVPEPLETVPKTEYKEHVYHVERLIPGVHIAVHDGHGHDWLSIFTEILSGYCEHHANKPKPQVVNREQFMKGFDSGIAAATIVSQGRINRVSDN